MDLKLSRLRRGEIIAAAAGVVLLALVFVLPWFGGPGRRGDLNGWHSLTVLRWLIIVTGLSAVSLGYLQATREAPALPVSMSVIATTLGALTVIALVIRVPTAAGSPRAGAYLGLLATIALTVGAFLSLRDEQGWVPGDEHPVQRLSVEPPQGG